MASHHKPSPSEEPNPNRQAVQGKTSVISHFTGNICARRDHRPHPNTHFSKDRAKASLGQVSADTAVTFITSLLRTKLKVMVVMILSTKKHI